MLAVLWLLLAVGERSDRPFRIVMAALWAALGGCYLVFGRTLVTVRGLRPAGRLRALRWRTSAACT